MKKDNLYRKLLSIVLPIILQNLLSSIVSASDVVMLGRLNQESLSAISLATQVTFIHTIIESAIMTGMTILAAQYWGKKDTLSVEKVLGITLKYSLAVSAVITFMSAAFPEVLMRIFTNDADMIDKGAQYLRIVSPTYIIMGLTLIYLCMMKTTGRTVRSMVYGSVAVVSNFILNAILIFGMFGLPELGIRGAAAATLISRVIELILVVVEALLFKPLRIKPSLIIHSDEYLKKDYIKYTTPVMMNEIAWGCGFAMFSVIMGHLGNDAVASNSVANIVKNILSSTCFGIGNGSSIIIGNELGRGNLEQAKRYGNKLCRISIINGIISGIIIVLCRPLFVAIGGKLTETATHYLKIELLICAYNMVGRSINSTTIAGIFCAGGDTKFGMLCDTITMWLVCVPLGAAAAFLWDLPVLWVYFILNMDEIVKLPAVFIHFRKYKWLVNLTKPDTVTE